MNPPTPTREDFTSPTETLVHIDHPVPDSFNRVRLIAFWQTDQAWVPGGVRAQVFHVELSQFAARVESRGGTVRVLNGGEQR